MKFISRQENLVVQNMDNETLVYDLLTEKAFLLNETAAFVWERCDGTKDFGEISRELAKKNNQPINDEIVWLTIDQLERNNLMSNKAVMTNPFGQTSRREIIKKVGLATMIALPLVTSLVAPKAAFAASARLANCLACKQIATALQIDVRRIILRAEAAVFVQQVLQGLSHIRQDIHRRPEIVPPVMQSHSWVVVKTARQLLLLIVLPQIVPAPVSVTNLLLIIDAGFNPSCR